MFHMYFTGISQKYPPPELFSFVNSSGDTLHGFYFKPSNYEQGKKYPTVLYVYGGPHVSYSTFSSRIIFVRDTLFIGINVPY